MAETDADTTTDARTIIGWIRAERIGLSAYLAGLESEAWSTPSLCPGWTVHDVVAHLTLSDRTSWRDFVIAMVAARGDFDRMEADRARRRAARYGPSDLVDQVRESADGTRRSPFSKPVDVLLDLLVHRQDIARPLGHRHVPPVERAVVALGHAAGSRFYGRKLVGGLELVADVDGTAVWRRGDGPEVRGPLDALLLAVTARPAAMEALTGPGAEILAERLTGPPSVAPAG